jgi:hypothetical protein
VHWPLVTLKARWSIPADGTKTMVAYEVQGLATKTQLLAAGIDWCVNVHDPKQSAELHHDLIRIAIEHLSPF